MTDTSIPPSIQEMIDLYIKHDYRPFTYNLLSKELDVDANTILKRVKRNPKYFKIEGIRPKIIYLNKDIEEIFFYRDKYKCRICHEEKAPNNLQIRLKDPFLKEDVRKNWRNIITCCKKCKDKDLVKCINKDKIEAPSDITKWEYKEVRIRKVRNKLTHNWKSSDATFDGIILGNNYEYHLEFNELNGQGWFHLNDGNNERCNKLSDILNYFGIQGWELFNIRYITYTDSDEIAERRCIFKRKINNN
jgi:hypothetical protein